MYEEKIQYFKNAAKNWRRYRQSRSYYWNQITRFISFYMTDTQSVIEIGCATGETLAQVPARRRVGIDFCDELIQQAREAHPSIEFHTMPAEDITLNEKFDVVIMSNLTGYLLSLIHI